VCTGFSQTQPSIDSPGAPIAVLSAIKDVIETQHHANSEEVYRIVSIRLGHCSVLYQMFSNEPKSEEEGENFRMLSGIYMKAAEALFPGDLGSFKAVLKQSARDFWTKSHSDQKAAFYTVRNCRDLSKPDAVAGAIEELLLF
jgi:hypothetical protein